MMDMERIKMIVCPNCGVEGLYIELRQTLNTLHTQKCNNCGYRRSWPPTACCICAKITWRQHMCYQCIGERYGVEQSIGDADLTTNYCPFIVVDKGRKVL